MSRLTRLEDLSDLPGPVALAIGVFDGVHRGHQEVIRAAVEHANQHRGTPVVMTFDPHPATVLNPSRVPPRLTVLEHQERLTRELGVMDLLALPFDRAMAETSAGQFIDGLVRGCRPLGCISVGYTWTFGKGREGNVHQLMDAGARAGFAVYGVPPLKVGDRVVSSTWVREAVAAGDLETAKVLLGRSFGYWGRVVKGRQLGRTLAFPTANVMLRTQVHPPAGVYACRAEVAGVWRAAVCNVGYRPTVEADGELTLEVHVLDWQGELYGQLMEVRLEQGIRPEQRFAGLDALATQIRMDVDVARRLLNS
jgi:riboflavin kinase/FMN adenylyltransferase